MSLLQTWDSTAEVSLRDWPQAQPRQRPPTPFTDVVTAFFRNLRGITIALAIFVLCITSFLLLSKKTYQSHLTYLVRGEGATFPTTTFDGQGSVAQMTSELVTDTQIGTEVELLSDMELHRKVFSELQPQASSSKIDSQLLSFDKHLKILPIPKTTLISVTYTGKSREEANATLAALNLQYLASRASMRGSERAFNFFDSEANRYYAQLQADQRNLAGFESQNQVTLLDEEKDLATHRLSETRAQLNENESAEAESSRKMAKMTAEDAALPTRIETQKRELPDQISEGHLNSLLIDLENKRQELLTKYHEPDRHVQEVDQQILNTRQDLKRIQASKATEVQSDLNPLRASVDSDLEHLKIQASGLQARQKVLRSQASAYDAELLRLDQITARHDDLVRSIKQDELNYELYSKRREEARIDKTLDGNKIANITLVAGPAISPEQFMQKVIAIASVYLIGSILIIGTGVLVGLWNPKFHTPWEIEAASGLPVLATVPFVKAGGHRGTLQRHGAFATSYVEGRVATQENSPPSTTRQGGHSTNGHRSQNVSGSAARAESVAKASIQANAAYSALIESLRRVGSSRPGGLAFAVTSSTRGEGVTHVVQGLANELERYTGKRVAVVSTPEDGSLPFAHLFSLQGETESGEEAVENWIRRLRETNDYVLIDCPSMQTSHSAITLGRETDGILLVVGAGDATRIQLRGSMAALSLASIRLVGVAMNKRTYPIPEFIYRAL